MENAEKFNERGCAYFKEGKAKEAIKTFNEAIQRNSYNAKLMNNLGVVFLTCGMLKKEQRLAFADKAHDAFGTAYTLRDRSRPNEVAGITNNRGVVLCNMKEKWPSGYGYPTIIDGFLKAAIKLDSNNSSFNYNTGHAYRLEGNYKEACKYLKDAWKYDKNNERILFECGCIAFLQGKREEAIKYYGKALELNPHFRDAMAGKTKAIGGVLRDKASEKALDAKKQNEPQPLEWFLVLLEN